MNNDENVTEKDEKVAVKLFVLESQEKESKFENECSIMQTLEKNDSFVRFYDYAISSEGLRKGYLIMEKCEGTFLDIINNKLAFPMDDGESKEGQLVKFMRQIFTALSLLAASNNPVAHRDIKPDNIFLKKNG